VICSSTLLLAVPANALGILPPTDPSGQHRAQAAATSLRQSMRLGAKEGRGPHGHFRDGVGALPIPEQIFTVVNLERVDRVSRRPSYMTSQLNADAQSGANVGG